jgi:hypothetical protein
MNAWEEAILKTYNFLGGNASNQEIYENVGRFIPLEIGRRAWNPTLGVLRFRPGQLLILVNGASMP